MTAAEVSTATTAQLNWLIALTLGATVAPGGLLMWEGNPPKYSLQPPGYVTDSDWMSRMVDSEGISLRPIRCPGHPLHGLWLAAYDHGNTGAMVRWVKREDWPKRYHVGETMFVAAARCYLAGKCK